MNINFKCFFLISIYALMLLYTPKLFNILENDSQGYINFTDIRTSFYPMLLKLCSYLNTEFYFVIILQVGLYLISLFFILRTLFIQKINILIILSFYFSLFFNIYLNAFHFTILTESLSFSFLFLFLTFLFYYMEYKKYKYLFFCTLFLSLIAFLRPSSLGFVFVSIIFLILLNYIFSDKKFYSFMKYIVLPFLIIFLIENYIYYNKHKERNSIVTNTHVYGKLIMLEVLKEESERFENLNNHKKEFIVKSKNYLNELMEKKEYCLFLERVGDLENYTYFKIEHDKNSKAFNLIFKDLYSFIKLTSKHYLNFFCVATPVNKNKLNINAPFIEADRFGENYRGMFIHITFLTLGILFYLVTFFFIIKLSLSLFIRNIKIEKNEFIEIYFISACHSFMIFISIFSISSPRHLMFIFPILILSMSITFSNLYKKILNFLRF